MLDVIVEHKRKELDALEPVDTRTLTPCARSLLDALRLPGLSLIAEVKRKAPSAGTLAESLDPVALSRSYVEGGARAISSTLR